MSRTETAVNMKAEDTKANHSALVEKAFLLIAGELEESKESETDIKEIKKIRMAILTGEKY